uniref:Uncharacterized protein n=1 Tax=Erpetoichthys calabaricus TaxID=27687 RepID=A0A8C4SIM5_ERPCA
KMAATTSLLEQAFNYDVLKGKVFKCYGISPEQQAREWKKWKFDPERPLRTQAFEAWSKVCCWLRPNINSSNKMGELLAFETFVHVHLDEMAQQIWRQNYDNMDTLIKIAKRHWSVWKSWWSERFSRRTQQVCGAVPEPIRQSPVPAVRKRDK